jgi:hypothetical protein
MSRPYHRAEIDKAFERAKALLHAQANKRGNGNAFYIDSYTGGELWGGDRYDYDHIFPSELIHTRYKDQLTDLQIAEIVNIPENIAVTLRTINQSKGKKNPEIWIQDQISIATNKINVAMASTAIKQAKQAIAAKARELGC